MLAKIYPFFDRPDVGIDVIYYGIPWKNPSCYRTCFDQKWAKDPQNYIYDGPTVDPKSYRYYPGEIPDGKFGQPIGTPDMFLNGISYETWINGGYPDGGCFPATAGRFRAVGDSTAFGQSGESWFASGDSSAAAFGSSSAASIFDADGDSTGNAYLPGTRLSRFVSDGSSTALAIQQSGHVATFTVAGNSTSSSIGSSTATALFVCAGDSTASSVGSSTAMTIFVIVGDSEADGVGSDIDSATFDATGDSACTGIGSSTAMTTFTVIGDSAADGVGNDTDSATFTATGDSSCSGIGASHALSIFDAIGDSLASSIGSSTAMTTFTVNGDSTCDADGVAGGIGTFDAMGDSSATGIYSSTTPITGGSTCSGATTATLGTEYLMSGTSMFGEWLIFPSCSAGSYHITTSSWSSIMDVVVDTGTCSFPTGLVVQSSAGCNGFTLSSSGDIFVRVDGSSSSWNLHITVATGSC